MTVATADHPASVDGDGDMLLRLATHALARSMAVTSLPSDAGRPSVVALPYTAAPVTFVRRRMPVALFRPPPG